MSELETIVPAEEISGEKGDLTPLQKAQEKMRQLRAAGVKQIKLDPVEKAKANPRSLKLAIRAHCWVCCGGEGDSGVKIRVRDCGLETKCSLWPHRPWQTAAGRINDEGDVEGVINDDAEDADESDVIEAGATNVAEVGVTNEK